MVTKMSESKHYWMKDLNLKKGALRKTLHVKSGKKIPAGKLHKAAECEGVSSKTAKRARLAEVFRKSFHG